jgi:hypothetical protein
MKFNNFRPKTQERLQAQTEVFADKGVKNFSEEQAAFLKHARELSKITDLNNLPIDLPEELVRLTRNHKKAYLDFLRQERKLETSFIEENTRLYRQKFQPVIAELKAKTIKGNAQKLPEYLGSGVNGSVFLIEVDGKKYAAKFSLEITQANFELKPLLRAKGVPHTAQLVSYSFEDGVVIMELLPGTDVTNFTPENIPEYSDKDIIQLIDTVRELDAKGIKIDPKPSNFMYDPTKGFSVLDFHLKTNDERYGLSEMILELRFALTKIKFPNLDYKAPDYEKQAETRRIEENKLSLPIMIKFLNILKEKYPDILAEWQQKHEENTQNPNMRVPELVDRRYIPEHPDLVPYLEKLQEMGF